MKLINVDEAKCIQCGICTKVCPVAILGMGKNGPEAIQPEVCIACGHCVAVCPHTALDNSKAPLASRTDLKEFPVLNAKTAEQFLRSRRSIRCFKQTAVPREQLLQLIEIARFAPTAGNQQDVSYRIVEDTAILKKATEVTIEWMEAQGENPLRWSFPYHVRLYRGDWRR